ncbi:hypothetical protein A5320_18270 [Rheinheimera sp. SA_1]|uniref:alpha/beta fold hydrolase n=1 Tax=Rheinheimera sp. SA_1 TaxID=1827365 RepID=UPI0007FC44FB|nr:alpha/beta hydrolase [Rheinheimera sp. SA_1]OBP13493.1 hypothetical protein A5320_18270 [Rheinheimera sp. SA_1]
MHKYSTVSHDGFALTYAVGELKADNPWIALIIPFGLQVDAACHFFDFFAPHYNVISWETRNILEDSERSVAVHEFTIENHVFDMKAVLDDAGITSCTVVGYCSGAGVALAAANRFPNIINDMVLLHGEYAMLHSQEYTTQFAAEIDSLLTLAATDEDLLTTVFDKISTGRLQQNGNQPEAIDLPFTRKCYLRRHCANYLAYKAVDYEALAKYASHKTLVMSGGRDVQTNIASSRRIYDLLPNAQLHIDPQADHYEVLRESSAVMVTIWNYLYDQRQQAS